MTDKYTYAIDLRYYIEKHIEIFAEDMDDYNNNGFEVNIVKRDISDIKLPKERGKRLSAYRSISFYADNLTAAQAARKMLWLLTHLSSKLTNFNRKSIDYFSLMSITNGIRNLLLTTNGTGTGLQEAFKGFDPNTSNATIVILSSGTTAKPKQIYGVITRILK